MIVPVRWLSLLSVDHPQGIAHADLQVAAVPINRSVDLLSTLPREEGRTYPHQTTDGLHRAAYVWVDG